MAHQEMSLIDGKILKFYCCSTRQWSSAWNSRLQFDQIVCYIRGIPYSTRNDNRDFYLALDHFQYEDFLKFYDKLLPCFAGSEYLLDDDMNVLDNLKLEWIGSNYTELKSTIQDFLFNPMENVLFLTAILERALGDVYYTLTKRKPPHLLKDLIHTSELVNFFGVDAIIVLIILLGSPKSINLRNIVWHGFPKFTEIPRYYNAVLIFTLNALGCIVTDHECEGSFKLCHRSLINDFSHFLTKCDDSLIINIDNVRSELCEALEFFDQSGAHEMYWYKLGTYYKNGDYWKFIMYVLPQIEHVLRLIYRNSNKCDVRAQLDKYYITIDTIFEYEVPLEISNISDYINKHTDRKLNNIFTDLLPVGAIKCLYDLFIASNGPRLRDKISHGEVDIAALDNAHLATILMHISLSLLSTDSLPLFNYESKYHLNCLTKEAIIVAHNQYDLLVDNQTILLQQKLSNLNRLKTFEKYEQQARIFQRPKVESELMLSLLQIAKHIEITCSNYDEAFEERLRLNAEHNLHSNRRKTLAKQMETFPDICMVLCKMCNAIGMCYLRMQIIERDELIRRKSDTWFLCDENVEKMRKFLKKTLQVSENLERFSHKQSNEWIKALDQCRNFEKLFIEFSLNFKCPNEPFKGLRLKRHNK